MSLCDVRCLASGTTLCSAEFGVVWNAGAAHVASGVWMLPVHKILQHCQQLSSTSHNQN